MEYIEFVKQKRIRVENHGFHAEDFNPMLFEWQQRIVQWALLKGRAAIFAGCGLGKTPMQLEWARHVHEHVNGPVLILAPLAVASQTRREGAKFGVEVKVCRKQSDIVNGVNIANYEMLEHFTPDAFAGIVLDESSILKAFMGKMRTRIIEAFAPVPYRLACTATPSPNDICELGNHSMFLGNYSLQEMQSRWFVNDSFNVGTYRLKKHAETDFWQWVASWAVCLEKPSDMGYHDGAFNLPPLNTVEHVLPNPESAMSRGMLIDIEKISASKVFKELKKSTPARAKHAASIAARTDGPCLVWCQTNDEADALVAAMPDAIEVRGNQKPERKEELLDAFATGKERVLITKASIAGWGLNFQHCANMVTVSPSYSFEMRYQAVRRCWRFGQTRPVTDNIIMTEKEAQIYHANQHKEKMHTDMVGIFRKMGHDLMPKDTRTLEAYKPKTTIKLPSFLRPVEA